MLRPLSLILRVKRIHRPRYGCRACESAVVQADAPRRPVDNGLPTAALLAHIAAAKFAWHLPLHRQTQMLAGYGPGNASSTLRRACHIAPTTRTMRNGRWFPASRSSF